MRSKLKKSVEVPPNIKAFIDAVVEAPAGDMSNVLDTFAWSYDKGDFNHWVPLINHLDQWLEKYVKPRHDLDLTFPEDAQPDPPFPSKTVLSILRVTALVLENCSNKHAYNSYEHMASLLAAPDPEVVVNALKVLAAFARKTSASSIRWQGNATLNSRLLAIAKGWGGKEEGLDLATCVSDKTVAALDGHGKGCTLHFEFYADSATGGRTAVDARPADGGSQVIHIPELNKLLESDHEILQQLVKRFNVPEHLRFSLLSRIRVARNFPSLDGRRHLVTLRLMAFYVLFQSNPVPEDINGFFVSEPEFVSELVGLLQSSTDAPEKLRYLSLRALAVQLLDRSRHATVINALSSGQGGLLALMMHKAVASLTAPSAKAVTDPSEPLTEGGCSLQTTEALLSLISLLVASSSGCHALSEAGMLPTLLPLMEDYLPGHLSIVCNTVRIMEAFMDFSSSASSLFRELHGLRAMIQRLKVEVHMDHSQAALDPANTTSKDVVIPYQRRVLLKALLRTIGLASYAPTSGTPARPEEPDCQELFECLKTMMSNAKDFGGGLFALAASVMTDLIHHDPLCYPTLDDAGLPQAYLKAVTDGLLASSEALCNLPNSLAALCVTNRGLERVREANALRCLQPILTSQKYLKALQGESASVLGAGLDELLRHVPSLRNDGIEVLLDTFKRICELGGYQASSDDERKENMSDLTTAVSGTAAGGDNVDPMEMETDARTAIAQDDNHVSEENDGPLETHVGDCIANAARTLESALSSTETIRLFLEKGGVELLLRLYSLPKLPISFGSGSSASNALLGIFRLFAPNNAATLSKSVRTALQARVEATLKHLEPICSESLNQLPVRKLEEATRAISATEGLAALTAAVVRSANVAMLQEVSSGTVPVLATISKLERIVLQQLSIVEPRKEEGSKVRDGATQSPTAAGPGDQGDGAELLEIEPPADRGSEVETMVVENVNVDTNLLPVPPEPVDKYTEKKKKKTPEDVCYDVLLHFVGTVRGLYSAVAKTVHTPTRRRDESGVIPSPSMIGAAAALALVLKSNLNSLPGAVNGATLTNMEEVEDAVQGDRLQSWLKQAGRVVEELSAVLFDSRRRSCHCLVLNFFIHFNGLAFLARQFHNSVEILWQSQHLEERMKESRTSDEPSAEPAGGPSDDKKAQIGGRAPTLLAEATVQAFLGLFEQLTNSQLILGTQQANALMSTKLPSDNSGEEAAASSAAGDEATAVMRNLQAATAEAVLPLWTHPNLAKASPQLLASVVSIITNSTDDAAAANSSSRAPRSNYRGAATAPDADMVQQLADMGFSSARAESALRQVGQNSVELALEWLVTHPDDPQTGTASAAATDGNCDMEAEAAADEDIFQILSSSFGKDVVQGREISPSGSKVEAQSAMPSIRELVDSAVSLLSSNPLACFSLSDLLTKLCSKDEGKERPDIVRYLMECLERAAATQSHEMDSNCSSAVMAPAHLLALLLTDDHLCRSAAADVGLVSSILHILDDWNKKFSVTDRSVRQVPPKWVDALLLTLHAMAQSFSLPSKPGEEGTAIDASPSRIDEDVAVPVGDGVSEQAVQEVARAGADSAANKLDKHFQELLKIWKPIGHINESEQDRAVGFCLQLLHHLHDRVPTDWTPPEFKPTRNTPAEHAVTELDPSATTQAVLQLLSRLTKRHSSALRVLHNGGPHLLLTLPRPCFNPQLEPYISAVLRHILEDPITLQSTMEVEIRSHISRSPSVRPSFLGSNGNTGNSLPLRSFLSGLSHVIFRDPSVFLDAVNNTCSFTESGIMGTHCMVKLKNSDSSTKPANSAVEDAARDAVKESKGTSVRAPTSIHASGSKEAKSDDTCKKEKDLAKAGKKVVPSSFVDVLDCLVDVVLRYNDPGEEISKHSKSQGIPDQKHCESATEKSSRMADTGKEVSDGGQTNVHEGSQESYKQLVQCVVLKMLTDFTLMYSSCIGVILKRDADLGGWVSAASMASHGKSTPGTNKSNSKHHHPALGKDHPDCAGVLHHVMHCHLVQPDNVNWAAQGIADQASCFLIAVCVRSVEARKRVIHELVATLNELPRGETPSLDSDSKSAGVDLSTPFVLSSNATPAIRIKAYVELIGSLLSASAAYKQPRNSSIGFSSEMIRVMREAGMIKALTRAMALIDLDHPRASKSVNSILKPLEILTRNTPGSVAGTDHAEASGRETEGVSGGSNLAAQGGTDAAAEAYVGGRDADAQAVAVTSAPALVTPGRDADTDAGPDARSIVDRYLEAENRRVAQDYDDMFREHGLHDDMMHDMRSEGSSGEEDDSDDDMDGAEDEEEDPGEGRIEGGSLDSDGSEDDEMGESSGDGEGSALGSVEDDDEDEGSEREEDADLIVDGEEEDMAAVADHDIPGMAEELDGDELEDEEISDDEQYLTDVEAEEDEDFGDGWEALRRLAGEHDEAWITDDDDLVGDPYLSGAMPSWARIRSDQLLMDHGEHMPSVDDFLELFQAHARGMNSYVSVDNRRVRRALYSGEHTSPGRNTTDDLPVSATMAPQPHGLMARPPGTRGAGGNRANSLPSYANSVLNMTVEPTFDWPRGSGLPRGSANLDFIQGGPVMFRVRDTSAGIRHGRRFLNNEHAIRMSPDAIRQLTAFNAHSGTVGNGVGRTSNWMDGVQRPSTSSMQGVLSSLESLISASATPSTGRDDPSMGRVQPRRADPSAVTDTPDDALVPMQSRRDTGGVQVTSAEANMQQLNDDVMAAQQQLRTQRLSLEDPSDTQLPSSEVHGQSGVAERQDPQEVQPGAPIAEALAASLAASFQAQARDSVPAPSNPTFPRPATAPLTHHTMLADPPHPSATHGGTSASATSTSLEIAEQTGEPIEENAMAEALRAVMASLPAPEHPQSVTQSGIQQDEPEAMDTDMQATPPGETTEQNVEQPCPVQSQGVPAQNTGLSEATRHAAEAAGVDTGFLEALPPELQAEVLAQQRVSVPPSAPAATSSPADGPVASVSAVEARAVDVAAAPEAERGVGEGGDSDEDMSIDPEFLAALPREIQEEVMAQQQMERRRRQRAREAARQRVAATGPASGSLSDGSAGVAAGVATGQMSSADHDMANVLATFPPDLREEVLLTGDETLLASLPPALMAEAQSLRERAMRTFGAGRTGLSTPPFMRVNHLANPYRTRPRSRHGSPADGRGADDPHQGKGARKIPEGPPQMDEEAIASLVQLLRLAQPLAKGQVQKVFLNICHHSQSCSASLRMLMSLLRTASTAGRSDSRRGSADIPSAQDAPGPSTSSGAITLSDALEHSKSIHTESLTVTSTASQQGSIPPLVMRRVLDLITWLSRSQPTRVARMLLTLGVPLPATTPLGPTPLGNTLTIGAATPVPDRKGKRKIEDTDVTPLSGGCGSRGLSASGFNSSRTLRLDGEPCALEVLLDLLGRPLCQRSSSHLEQALHLLEVILSAGRSLMKEQEQHQGVNAGKGAGKVGADDKAAVSGDTSMKHAEATVSGLNSSTPPLSVEAMQATLTSLPRALISQLPQLLARQGLANESYDRTATVMSLLGQTMPGQQAMLLTELSAQLEALLGDASHELSAFGQMQEQLVPKATGTIHANASTSTDMAVDRALLPVQAGALTPGGVVRVPSAPLVLRLLQAIYSMCKITAGHPSENSSGRRRSRIHDSVASQVLGTAPAPSAAEAVDAAAAESTTAALSQLAEELAPLWASLSQAITVVEANIPKAKKGASAAGAGARGSGPTGLLPPGAQQILPLVEAFFVLSESQSILRHLCESLDRQASNAAAAAPGKDAAASNNDVTSGTPAVPGDLLSAAENQHIEQLDETSLPFLYFAEQHRRLLNALLQQTPSLLEGSLAPLLRTPRLVEFENKRTFFQNRMNYLREDRRYGGSLRICVRRDHVFEDSFHQLRMRTADEMRCKLSVQFQGEEGIDAGGVSREWYQVMAREIFNPGFSLFVNVPEGGTTFQPNPNSMVQNDEARGTNHLDYFKFVGRVIGKALHDGLLIDAYFTRSFYKHMLGLGITYEDIEAVDPEYYRTLKWMLENDITDVLDMNFTAELDYFGKKQVVELRPGGAAQKVTQANKRAYVSLVAKHVMTNAIRDQITAFLQGFWELVPKNLVRIFNDHELELLISGLPDIDVDDLRNNTEYHGFTAASPVVQWFWEVVRDMEGKSLALLLQFVTGTSKVPLEGFKALQGISGPQKFQIHKAYGPNNRLPSAHTCFNQLDLIEYDSKEQLEDRLMTAIREGSEGFGFG